jgi:hypothetical protein
MSFHFIYILFVVVDKKKKKKKILVESPWWRNLTWVSRATCFTISSHIGNIGPLGLHTNAHTHYNTIMVVPFWKKKKKKMKKKTDVIWRFSIVKKEEGARSFLGNTTRLFMTLFGRVWIIFGLDSPTFKVALHKPKPKTQKQKTLSK